MSTTKHPGANPLSRAKVFKVFSSKLMYVQPSSAEELETHLDRVAFGQPFFFCSCDRLTRSKVLLLFQNDMSNLSWACAGFKKWRPERSYYFIYIYFPIRVGLTAFDAYSI